MKMKDPDETKQADHLGVLKGIKKEIVTLKSGLNELLGGRAGTTPDVKPASQKTKLSRKGRDEIANSGQPPFQIF